MRKILYIVQHRKNRSPGQRFRCEQYLEYLEKEGFEIEYSNLLSENDDKIFYSSGRYIGKFRILLKSIKKRLRDIEKAKSADIVFIYREAFMLGSTFFEKRLKKTGAKIIFDFDDSIWLNDTSDGNKNLSWLKKPEKTAEIVRLSDLIIAGNDYLANYCMEFNKNVFVVPTTIDTSYHKSNICKKDNGRICIGWTGTATTLKHFKTLLPVLEKLKKTYSDKVYFKAILNADYSNETLNLKSTPWKLETEIEDLCEIDIGIMPLPNDKWSNGKCGFKGLQYMSLEIPTVMSPVGVNQKIISNGVNGFLASSPDEWENILCRLIDSKELRNKVGKAGRETIEQEYSVISQKERYVSLFKNLLQ